MSPDDNSRRSEPGVTPAEGLFKPGLIYIDDSATALHAMRCALYAHGILLETFTSFEAFQGRGIGQVVAALFDVDLANGESGDEAARHVAGAYPGVHVAFITADSSPERVAMLRPMGEVFSKSVDVARAALWFATVAADARARLGHLG